MQTVVGSQYNDTFLPGSSNVTVGGCDQSSTEITACGDDTISFAQAPAAATVVLDSSGATNHPIGQATGGYGGTITLVDISNVIGSPYGSTITGDTLPGTLIGVGGNNTFIVKGGNDTIDGGPGADNTLSLAQVGGQATVDLNDTAPQDTGAAGTLTVVGGSIQTLIASAGGSDLSAGSGNVTLVGGPGTDWLAAGSGTQTIDACMPSLSACGNDDVIEGGIGLETLTGGPVATTFQPGQGTETIVGTSGASNTLTYAAAPAAAQVNLSGSLFTVPAPISVYGSTPVTLPNSQQSVSALTATGGWGAIVNLAGANINDVIGSPYSDVLVTANSGADTISGDGGNDVIVATGGNNVLSAGDGTLTFFIIDGSGNNQINGGGDSVIDYSLAPAGADINLQTGIATGGFGGSESLTGIASAIGTQYADVIVAGAPGGVIIGLNGNNVLQGGPSGGDTLISGGGGNNTFCASSVCAISGTEASSATGTTGDTLIGGTGDDTFFTVNGVVDTVTGGPGYNEAQADADDKLTNISVLLPPPGT
jgi:Ca2+-binding RTX toxin-like protein